MNTEENFRAVMDRAKRAFGVDTDTALGMLLGLKQAAFSNRRASGSIPYPELIAKAAEEGIDLNWLLTGEPTQNVMEPPGRYVVARAMDETVKALENLPDSHRASILEAVRQAERFAELERRVAALESQQTDPPTQGQSQTIHGNVQMAAGRDIRRGK